MISSGYLLGEEQQSAEEQSEEDITKDAAGTVGATSKSPLQNHDSSEPAQTIFMYTVKSRQRQRQTSAMLRLVSSNS